MAAGAPKILFIVPRKTRFWQGAPVRVVAEVTQAHLPNPITGRPDAAILEMKDLGDKFFYGG